MASHALLIMVLIKTGLQFAEIEGSITHHKLYAVTAFSAHKNILAETLFLGSALSCAGLFVLKNKVLRIISVALPILAIVCIGLLYARGAWVGLLVSTVMGLMLFIIKFRAKAIKIGLYAILMVGAAIFMVFGIIKFTDKDNTYRIHVHSILDFQYGTTKDRLQLWKKTVDVYQASPVTGTGFGDWKIDILAEGNEKIKSEDNVTFYQRPHNDLLWILTENGTIGLLLYLAFFLHSLLLLANRYIKCKDSFAAVYLVCFAALWGYLVLGLFNFPHERIEHLSFLALFFALAFNIHKKETNPGITLNHYLLPVLTATLLFLLERSRNEKMFKQLLSHKVALQWVEVLNASKKINHGLYPLDPYSTPIAWYQGLAYYVLKQEQNALLCFEKAVKVNPHHIHALNNAGALHEKNGSHQLAMHYLERSNKIAPNFQETSFNLALICYQQKKYDEAYVYLRQIDEEQAKQNPRFGALYEAIAEQKTNNLHKALKNKQLSETLLRILKDKTWLHDLHYRSIKKQDWI
ncbi:MAG: tetratricopeptide repeat protein [Bacteroidales bacterium]|nr:tetratricopeptide repeat protein [Bacteroidales bacterium]